MQLKNFLMTRGLPGEQDLYNKGFRLEIYHLPTDYSVAFSAMIEQMSDAYNSEWNAEQVFGRMDPIGTYSHTTRAISVAWKVPATSFKMAKDNLDKTNRLVSFLYGTYSDKVGATTMNQGPLWGVKFGNLICNASTGGPLLGWVRGITVDPILEDGIFTDEVTAKGTVTNAQTGASRPPVGMVYFPKTLRLNFELRVLHEHDLGWVENPASEKGREYVFKGGKRDTRAQSGMSFPYAATSFVSDQIDEGTAPNPPPEPIQEQPIQEIVDPNDPNRTILIRKDPSSPGAASVKNVTARSRGRRLIKRGSVK
tara:strand:- start:871 stop:1800 length:930 start_codon:yes stop_codon:yes gene_type:complete